MRRTAALCAFASFFLGVAGAPPVHADPHPITMGRPTINTVRGWNGSTATLLGTQGRGDPHFPSVGQIITAPEGTSTLVRMKYLLSSFDGSGDLVLRGEVYSWNGEATEGQAVWESSKRTVTLDEDDPTFQSLNFKVRDAELEPGATYVLFITMARDWRENPDDLMGLVAVRSRDVYSGGPLVSHWDNEPSEWNDSGTWNAYVTSDLAFKAWFE